MHSTSSQQLNRQPDVMLQGRFAPGEQRRYRHVPFTVPPGVRQLHLAYEYTERIGSDPLLFGGNTLDLGLFDERGTAAGSPGFRGWSGSNKSTLTIDEAWSTPPYQPGLPGAGVWHVLLGPYKIGPRGLDYTVNVWFNSDLFVGRDRIRGQFFTDHRLHADARRTRGHRLHRHGAG